MKSQTKALAGSLKGMLAGALGFTALVAGFRATFREMDRVHKLGLRFNESAETIQRLDVASRIAGAGIEQVAKAIQTATRNAREASDGVATYVDAFEELGIAPRDFINLPMEEKLKMLAGALNKVEGDGNKVGLALDVMGRQGAELLPMLKDLEAALGEDIPVASQQTVDRIAAANDAMTRFGNSVKVAIAESVSAIGTLIDKLAEVTKTGNLADLRLSETFQKEAKRIRGVVDAEREATTKKKQTDGKDEVTEEDADELEKKQKELDKLREKVAEAEKERDFNRMTTAQKIDALEKEDRGLGDVFSPDEETRLKAELRSLEIQKELIALEEQLKREREDAEKERLASLEEIEKKEREIAEVRRKQAEEIREQGLEIVAEKQQEIDSLDSGPRLKASDLASVGGGGLAALTDTTAIAERQAQLQSEILEILRLLPTEEETTVEPTA